MTKRRIRWRYPFKSKERLQKRLTTDKKDFGGTVGDLRYRNLQIVRKQHKDGTYWYHAMVDDI